MGKERDSRREGSEKERKGEGKRQKRLSSIKVCL